MKVGRQIGPARAVVSVYCVLVCCLCMGCAGVVPLSRQTHTPQGTNENVHLSFLHVGQTNREEVRDKLKVFDTGVQSERFFLGRWTSSTWAWFAGSQGGAMGGRHWSTTNLLIEFDEKGVVKKFESFSDKDLQRELVPLMKEQKSPETSERLGLAIQSAGHPAEIILSGGNLEFVGMGDRKTPDHFTIGAGKVLSIVNAVGARIDPAYCDQKIQFTDTQKTPGKPKVKRIYVEIKLPDLLTLLSYIQANSAT